MNHPRMPWVRVITALALQLLVSCGRQTSNRLQGYVEGEFVYVSSPLGGKLEKLGVQRGALVKGGDVLFSLESTAEKAMRDEAGHRLQQACASLEDAKKGRRPTEIEALQAQIKQAQAATDFSEKELARQMSLKQTGAVAIGAIDQTRSTNDQNHHRVEQLKAELKTAQLGSRSDLIAAAEAEVHAHAAALTVAEWNLAQKQQATPQDGLISDTLYHEGEFVAAGRPVVVLLPPGHVKVRAFVPETRIATLHQGDAAKVHVDGMAESLTGHVSFISPQSEYTPPVIYSQENRSKLVFMIELRFDDAVADRLHPGQPVGVELAPQP